MARTLVQRFARGVARAEGFFLPGSRAARNHNPGNLTEDLTGKAVGKDSGQFIKYATDADGFEALEKQVSMMFFGGSAFYNDQMTIAEVAAKWTTTQQLEWARNVAGALGVSTATKLSDIV